MADLNFFDQAKQLGRENAIANQPAPKSNVPTLGDVVHGAIGAGIGLGIVNGITKLLGVEGKFKERLQDLAMLAGGAWNTGYIKTSEERRHAFRLGFVKAAYDKGLLKSALTLNGAEATVHQLAPTVVEAREKRRAAFDERASALAKDSGGTVTPAQLAELRRQLDKEMPESTQLKSAAIAPLNIPITPDLITAPFRMGANMANTAGSLAGSAAGAISSPTGEDEAVAKIQVETELLKQQLAKLEADKKNRLIKSILARRRM